MIKTITLGTLAIAFVLTANIAFADTKNASSTHPLINMIENKIEHRNSSSTHDVGSTTRPALRDRGNNATSTKMVDSTCAKSAVDVRKTSLVSVYGTFSTSLSSALSTREDAVKSSFDKTTKKDREAARKDARTAYKKSVKSAFDTLKTNEKTAMKTYATSIKACGGTSAEASEESSDGSFGDSIK